MKVPLIVVTGPIASGKSTVAKVMAEGGGVYVDADMLLSLIHISEPTRLQV